MKNLIEETVQKIKNQRIAPQPRWKHLLKKYLVWFLFLAAIFLGAISFSIAFGMLRQLDWDLYRFAHQSAVSYSLKLLPYFWIFFIGLFLYMAFFDMRKTETGYRYSWLKISLLSIAAMIGAGFIFSFIGMGAKLNEILLRDVPYYGQHMVMTKEKQWMQPDSGFLAGTLGATSRDELELNDLSGQKWKVLVDEKTLIRPAADIEQGKMIKIIGSERDKNTFQAAEIRPWNGQGEGSGGRRRMMRMNQK